MTTSTYSDDKQLLYEELLLLNDVERHLGNVKPETRSRFQVAKAKLVKYNNWLKSSVYDEIIKGHGWGTAAQELRKSAGAMHKRLPGLSFYMLDLMMVMPKSRRIFGPTSRTAGRAEEGL